MPKIAVGTEIKAVKVPDSKFAAGAKTAAAKGVEKAFKKSTKYEQGKPPDGGYFILFTATATLDKTARTMVGTCTWEINLVEKGTRKLFMALKQAKPASATVPDVDPLKVTQADVDEAIASACEAEVTGLLKKLP